jgi:hypothetical protein
VVFKGSGFYQTDYRSESYKKAADADSKASSPEKKGEAKGDEKAGQKAEPKSTDSPVKKKKPKE